MQPGSELHSMYQKWKVKLPELQRQIVNPSLSRSQVRELSIRIKNLKCGIEKFEDDYPAFAIKDASNSKVIQKAMNQGLLF